MTDLMIELAWMFWLIVGLSAVVMSTQRSIRWPNDIGKYLISVMAALATGWICLKTLHLLAALLAQYDNSATVLYRLVDTMGILLAYGYWAVALCAYLFAFTAIDDYVVARMQREDVTP